MFYVLYSVHYFEFKKLNKLPNEVCALLKLKNSLLLIKYMYSDNNFAIFRESETTMFHQTLAAMYFFN